MLFYFLYFGGIFNKTVIPLERTLTTFVQHGDHEYVDCRSLHSIDTRSILPRHLDNFFGRCI